jgi:hypothetical protein
MRFTNLWRALTLVGASLILSSYAFGQAGAIYWINQNSCSEDFITDPNGGYFAQTPAECNMEALCVLGSDNLEIYAYAWSPLACPTDSVENTAMGGWNQADTVNALAQAFDMYNGMVRGTAFSQESCNGVPVYFSKDSPEVCGQLPVIDDPPGGGGGFPGGGGSKDPGVYCLYGVDDMQTCDEQLWGEVPYGSCCV